MGHRLITCCTAPLQRRVRARSAFTLVEVVVVLAVIIVLYAILAPVMVRARVRAGEAQCASNLRQVGTALELYHQDYGEYPNWRPAEQMFPKYLSAPELFVCPLDNRDLGELDASSEGNKAKYHNSYLLHFIPHKRRDKWMARRGSDFPLLVCPVHNAVFTGKPFYHVLRLHGGIERVPEEKIFGEGSSLGL